MSLVRGSKRRDPDHEFILDSFEESFAEVADPNHLPRTAVRKCQYECREPYLGITLPEASRQIRRNRQYHVKV